MRAAHCDGNHTFKSGDRQMLARLDLRIVRIDRAHQFALFRILDDFFPGLIQNLIRFENQRVRLDGIAAHVLHDVAAALDAAEYRHRVRRGDIHARSRRIASLLIHEHVAR